MIKMLLGFVIVFATFFVGIAAFTKASKSDKLGLLKIAGYSIICSLLTFAVLTLIVVFF